MFKKLLILAFVLLSSPAWAQNTQCSDRPTSDSSNACANTRFVQAVVNSQVFSITAYGAKADGGLTDNGPFIRLAMDAAALVGGVVYIPPAATWYGVSTCRNNAVFDMSGANGNRAVSIYGGGWNAKPFAAPTGSWLLPNSSFPSTCSWIRYAGTDAVTGITFHDFAIGEFGGAYGTPKGLHGIFVDETSNPNFYVNNLNIDHVFIANMAIGYSIRSAGVQNFAGAVTNSIIQNSSLMNISAPFFGDGNRIDGNTLGGNATIDSRNVGIQFSNCDGCASTIISRNNILNFNGKIIVDGAIKCVIRDNELEQQAGTTNINGAVIDLNGSTGEVENCTVTGNAISQNSSVANYKPISVGNAKQAQIYDNRIVLAAAAPYDYVSVNVGTATGTYIGINRCAYNGTTTDFACTISALGPNGRQDTPYGFSLSGSTSGLANITTQPAAGTPALKWPTTSGTLPSTAVSPLALNSISGALTCSTCATSAGASIPSVATGDILYGSGTNVLSSLADVATGNALISGGVGVAPLWGKIGISTHVSGLGTGIATALGVNVGTAGAPVINGGALGTPSSGTATNLTGTAASLTAGTATNATNGATVATSTNATFFPLFVASSTNSTQPFNLDLNYNYNPSTDTLSASNMAAPTSLVTPLRIGGAAAGSSAEIRSTSGTGSGDLVSITGGTNGATRVATFLGTGRSGFGSAAGAANPTNTLSVISANATTQDAAVTSYATMQHLVGADSTNPSLTMDAFSGTAALHIRAANGTAAAKTAVGVDQGTFVLLGDPYDGSAYTSQVGMIGRAAQNVTGANKGTYLQLLTTPNGSTTLTESVRVQNSGGVSIGTTTDPGLGGIQINGQGFIPNIASDTATVDNTVCVSGTGKLLKGTGALGVCLGTSSARFKHDVVSMGAGLAELIKLSPKNFFYNKGYGDDGKRQQYGFIAEDVVKALPGVTSADKDGKPQSVDMLAMVPIMVNAIKQLKAVNDNLESRLVKLEARK